MPPTPPMRHALLLLLLAAGCAPSRPTETDTEARPPEAAETDLDLLPIVRLEAGRADTLAADLFGRGALRFASHPDVRAARLGDGRVVVEALGGFTGLALLPFTASGADYALAVQSTAARAEAPGLRLEVEGLDPADPSLLRFSVRQPGVDAVVELDEEESPVALLDNRPFQDNAVDAFDGVVLLDLDAAGPGDQRLRVAVRTDGLVSNWVEVPLRDGRPLPGASG